jgi:hypothetical protein
MINRRNKWYRLAGFHDLHTNEHAESAQLSEWRKSIARSVSSAGSFAMAGSLSQVWSRDYQVKFEDDEPAHIVFYIHTYLTKKKQIKISKQ